MHNVMKVEYFINRLKGELLEQVRFGDPATLNEAIDRAKMVERVKNEKIQYEVMQKINEIILKKNIKT